MVSMVSSSMYEELLASEKDFKQFFSISLLINFVSLFLKNLTTN